MSLSASCDTDCELIERRGSWRDVGAKGNRPGVQGDLAPARSCGTSLRGDLRALEMLVRRAVVALRQRRALAGLALAGRRLAAGDASVERAGLDLLVDELDGRVHAFLDRPAHLRLVRDREVAPD